MKNIFKRCEFNPILKPDLKNTWESLKLYNPGVIYYEGKYHMFYRAIGKGADWQSAIGYAVSEDGENFQRFDNPLLTGKGLLEKRGMEDPRITKIGTTFYMAYAAYDGITPRLNIATSYDLKKWKKHGHAFCDWNFEKAKGSYIDFDENGKTYVKPRYTEWSKSGGIFPEKINKKYWMMFGEEKMWFATSDDGINWKGELEPFLCPRSGNFFDNVFVEMGPPPIKTSSGWLVLYHGVNKKHWYQIGYLLLDLKNPRKIKYRSEQPIFKPEKAYEMNWFVDVLPGGITKMEAMTTKELEKYIQSNIAKGIMPRVVFCCGAVLKDDVLHIYYGAGDFVICTATAKISDVLSST